MNISRHPRRWRNRLGNPLKVETRVRTPLGLPVALLHWAQGRPSGETPAMRSHPDPYPHPAPSSAFAGYRFPPEVITLAVRWYLRFGLSYRDVEELLAERGIEVDHV